MKNRIKKRCLIGEKYVDEIQELKELGVEPILLKQSPYLDDEINAHADILSFYAGNKRLLLASHLKGEYDAVLDGYSIDYVNSITSPYPNDIKLNATILGELLICKYNATTNKILSSVNSNKIKVLNVNQGYTKCNLCILNDYAVITSDSNLTHLLKKSQIDVLEISQGNIYLSDIHFGFIGGASGKLTEDAMYFSGDLSSHPDYNKIIRFLNKYNIKPIFNKNRQLKDFGGFIMID